MDLTQKQRWVLSAAMTYAMYAGFGTTFIVPFAIALGASNTYIGVLSAMPFLAMILTQFPSQILMAKVGKRAVYVCFGAASRIFLPLAGLAPFILGPALLPALLLIIFFTYLFDTFAEAPWLTITSETVSEKHRGEFFSLRALLFHIGLTSAMVVGGVFLDFFPENDLRGFTIIFCIASVLGLICTYTFGKIKPKFKHSKKAYNLKTFFNIKGKFAKFLAFMFVFGFGYMIAGPFFKVYILENLGMSYTFFTLAMSMTTVGRLFSLIHVGKLADKIGDKKIIIAGAWGTILAPVGYIFINTSNVWLIFPLQLFIGVAWAGIDVGALNLLIDLSSKKERHLRAAQYYTIAALPHFIAPILGGLIADNLTFVLTGIPLVFAIAAIIRVASGFILISLEEPRAKKQYTVWQSIKEFFSWNPAKDARYSLHQISQVFLKHERYIHKVKRNT